MTADWRVGTELVHRATLTRRIVTRITPAGAAGTRVSDGPVFHATLADPDIDYALPIQGGHTADIWLHSTTYPISDFEEIL